MKLSTIYGDTMVLKEVFREVDKLTLVEAQEFIEHAKRATTVCTANWCFG
jgi:ribosomal protein L7/L12